MQHYIMQAAPTPEGPDVIPCPGQQTSRQRLECAKLASALAFGFRLERAA
jgi:hypothetical protein